MECYFIFCFDLCFDIAAIFCYQAPLATMALALTVANLGIIPFESPICKHQHDICFVGLCFETVRAFLLTSAVLLHLNFLRNRWHDQPVFDSPCRPNAAV